MGVGVFKGLSDIKRFVEVDEVVAPDPRSYGLYSKLYGIYLKLYEATKGEAGKLHLISLGEDD
ncbi:MAG: hypothetical protein QW176_00515 [Candidatus Bathyarchaeia archaeon]